MSYYDSSAEDDLQNRHNASDGGGEKLIKKRYMVFKQPTCEIS